VLIELELAPKDIAALTILMIVVPLFIFLPSYAFRSVRLFITLGKTAVNLSVELFQLLASSYGSLSSWQSCSAVCGWRFGSLLRSVAVLPLPIG